MVDTLRGPDSVFYLVGAQHVASAATSRFSAEPEWVFSQAAANILAINASAPNAISIRFCADTLVQVGADDTVTIPLSVSISPTTVRFDSLVIHFQYDRRMLYPLSINASPWCAGADWVASSEGAIATLRLCNAAMPPPLRIQLQFLVAMASDTATELRIDSALADDYAVSQSMCRAIISSKGVCGLHRLLFDSSSALLAFPNPAANELSVEFWSDRPGCVSVEMVDVLDRMVGRFEGAILPQGKNRLRSIDVSRMAPGAYRLILRTPTSTSERIIYLRR
jgi:hypothetical protein